MSNITQNDPIKTRSTRAAVVSGFVGAFVTAGAVSWATPDGNLVVTLVPALVIGLIVYGLALWLSRRRHSL